MCFLTIPLVTNACSASDSPDAALLLWHTWSTNLLAQKQYCSIVNVAHKLHAIEMYRPLPVQCLQELRMQNKAHLQICDCCLDVQPILHPSTGSVCMQLLVEKGADVNRSFTSESLPAVPFKHLVTQCPTPLHLACDRGDIELVKVWYTLRLSLVLQLVNFAYNRQYHLHCCLHD